MSRKRWGIPPIVGPRLVRILKEPWWGHEEGIVEGERYYPRIHATKYRVVFPSGSKAEFLREELEVLPETPYAEEGVGMAGRMSRKRWGKREGGLLGDGKFHEIIQGYYYATQENWVAGLDDDETIQLAVIAEVMDMYEATGDAEFEQYPFNLEVSIVVAYPGPAWLAKAEESGEGSGDPAGALFDSYHYGGGVPIIHDLLSIEGGGADLDRWSARKMMWVRKKADYGTVAAQQGPGTIFEYPQFRDEKTALEFVNELLKRVPAVMMMIGFFLDRPINMKGDLGWSVIQGQAR